jgi:hypothetical protein
MQLRALVDSKNLWTQIALWSIYTLVAIVFISVFIFWWNDELIRQKDGLHILLFLSLFALVLLAVNWFSQLKVKEVFETMMMNQRVLSVIAEDHRTMFQDFCRLDLMGYQVDEVFKHFERFDLSKKYGLELLRIRRKMRKIFGEESAADPAAKKRAQATHDEIATLATWKRVAHLEDLNQAETAPSELAVQPEEDEDTETIFFT